jgi:hypothetical protein
MQTRARAALKPLRNVETWRILPYPTPSTSNLSNIPLKGSRRDLSPNDPAADSAVQRYYHYFYPRLRRNRNLVDAGKLQTLWKPCKELVPSSTAVAANTNTKNFVIESETDLLPEIWLMSIVVAALDTRAISRVADDTTQQVLAEVFENWHDGNLGPGCYIDDNGIRAKRLAADIGFWRVHAQDRGIDAAMASAIKIWQSSPTYDFSFVTLAYSKNNDLTKLVTWLLGTRYTSTLSVTDFDAYEVAKLLRVVGMRIEINGVSSPIGEEYPPELSVCLAESPASVPAVEDPTESSNFTGSAALLMCLMDQNPNESTEEQTSQ